MSRNEPRIRKTRKISKDVEFNSTQLIFQLKKCDGLTHGQTQITNGTFFYMYRYIYINLYTYIIYLN